MDAVVTFKKQFLNILSSSYVKNSIWAILGAFISKGLNFAAIIYVARIIGPKVFGEYNVIQTTIGLFGTVSGLGLGLAATKLVAEWRTKDLVKVGELLGTLYCLALAVSIVVSCFFFLFSGIIDESLLSNISLITVLRLSAIIVIFEALNGVQNGLLIGFEKFKKIAFINLIIGIVSTPLMILGAYYSGLFGLTLMLLISRICTVIITRFYISQITNDFGVKIDFGVSYERLKPIFKISLPAFFTNMATSPVNWLSTTIFVNQPFGYTAIGTYNAANQLRQLVLFLPDSAGKVSIPKMANQFSIGDLKAFKKTVLITFLWNFLLSLFPAAFIYFLSYLFQYFIGGEYLISQMLILSILFTGIFIALTNAIGYVFICSNLMWYDFVLRVFWGIAQIAILYFYGKNHGALGFSLSILGGYIIYFIFQCIFLLFKFSIISSILKYLNLKNEDFIKLR